MSRFVPRVNALEGREMPSLSGLFAVGGGPGSSPRVDVYDNTTGARLAQFQPFENTFLGGVTVAVGDVTGDLVPDLIVGASEGGGPRVQVYNGATLRTGFNPSASLLADFFAFESSQRGGVTVAAGRFFGTSFDEVVVGAGPGGGPRVRILDGQQILQQGRSFTSNLPNDTVANFFAFEPTLRTGINVAANPVTQTLSLYSDLIVAPGAGGGPRVRVLSGFQIAGQRTAYTSNLPTDQLANFFAGNPNTRAGVFVASADVNFDGSADVFTGTGAGIPAAVTIYNGVNIRANPNFSGFGVGDIVLQFQPRTNYSNGVTVGMTQYQNAGPGLLITGIGGADQINTVTLSRFSFVGANLVRNQLFSVVPVPGLIAGVYAST
jgi:hypothetical protein